MRRFLPGLALTAALLVSACSDGGGASRCDTTGGQDLATGPWPKFRHDRFNTGRVDDPAVNLSTNTGVCRWQFPADGSAACGPQPPAAAQPAKGSFSASPTLSADGSRVYIGSADGNLYAIDAATGGAVAAEQFSFASQSSPINSSAAVAADGSIFVETGGNSLLQINTDGTTERTAGIGGFGAASPALASDGTVFAGSTATATSGFLTAVCANGVPRWTFAGEPAEASAAISPDGTLANGKVADCTVSDDAAPHGVVYTASASSARPYLRALDRCTGSIKWTFSVSSFMVASPVLEVKDNEVQTVFVADQGGRLFALDADGSRRAASGGAFEFVADNAITASPALGYPNDSDGRVDTVYIAATDGRLYAVDLASAQARAVFETDGAQQSPPLGIQSSPAVARDGDATTIVFGADDGIVYRLIDTGGDTLTEAWRVALPRSDPDEPAVRIGRSSPAIGTDGTVYIAAEDGRVYAIGAPLNP